MTANLQSQRMIEAPQKCTHQTNCTNSPSLNDSLLLTASLSYLIGWLCYTDFHKIFELQTWKNLFRMSNSHFELILLVIHYLIETDVEGQFDRIVSVM